MYTIHGSFRASITNPQPNQFSCHKVARDKDSETRTMIAKKRVTFAADVRGGDEDNDKDIDKDKDKAETKIRVAPGPKEAAPELGGRVEALKLKRRREALRRDFQCQLLVARVSQDAFKQALLQFKPGDYREVVVERALDQLCGYPLCMKPVGDWSALPRKKISWRHKAIYDRNKLKEFCSISCMNKSEAIEESLPLLKEGSLSAETAPQPVVFEAKRATTQQLTSAFPSPGSMTSALMVEGYKTSHATETIDKRERFEQIETPAKAQRKEVSAESKGKDGVEEIINDMLTSPEQIANDVEQFKLGSFLKLWSALSDFVDVKIDDRKDYPTLESVEFDDFTGRRHVLRGHLVRAAAGVLQDIPSLAELFTRQYLAQLVVEGAGRFNISRPVASLSVQEWKVLVVLLLEGALEQLNLPAEHATKLKLMKEGLYHSLSITTREGTLLSQKLMRLESQPS